MKLPPLVLLALASACGAIECPSGWTRIGNICYVFRAERINSQDAVKTRCQEMGGKILDVSSAAEARDLERSSNLIRCASEGPVMIWLGGRFVNSTDELPYLPASTKAPIDFGGNCVALMAPDLQHAQFFWTTLPCTISSSDPFFSSLSYICESLPGQ